MIVDRIYEYLESRGQKLPQDVVDFALKRVERTVRRNLGELEDRSRPRQISGSLAWYCPRRAYYQLTGAEQQQLTARARVTFLMGDVLQACIDVLSTMAGVVFEYPDSAGDELELRDTISGVEVVGHVDHALRTNQDGLLVVDSKSMSAYGFDEFKAAATNPEHEYWKKERWGYLAQVRFYAMLVRRLGLGTGERSILLAICKNTGHMAEMIVPRDPEVEDAFLRAIPRLGAARAQYQAAREAVVATVLANGGTVEAAEKAAAAVPRVEATGLLPRASWANAVEVGIVKLPDGSRGKAMEVDTDSERTRGNGWRCNYCPFVTKCFEGFELVPMSKPVYRKALNK